MDPIVATAIATALSEGIKYLARLAETQQLVQDGQITEEEALLMLQSAQIRFGATQKRWDELVKRRASVSTKSGP